MPLRIQMLEMELMYNSIITSHKDPEQTNDITRVKYANLDDYIERTLNNMASGSHGNVILMEGNKEIKIVLANPSK